MLGFTDYLANAVLNHVFRGVAYTPPAGIWIALYSDLAATNELTNYTREPVTFKAAVSRSIVNDSTPISFDNLNATTIRAVYYVDTASGATRKLAGGPLDVAVSVTAGETLTVDPQTLTIRVNS